MKTCRTILLLAFLLNSSHFLAKCQQKELKLDFFGDPVDLILEPSFAVAYGSFPGINSILEFHSTIEKTHYQSLVESLLQYRKLYQLDDWLYYQLIRSVAQQISPKKDNYYRYTLYKWFLMQKSGYEVSLKVHGDKLLFYTWSEEAIYNIPFYTRDNKQFVCLNYHDYGSNIDFNEERFVEIPVRDEQAQSSFSYKINHLPVFHPGDYQEKEIRFSLSENEYAFKVKLNPQVKTIFTNYPVVEYESYLNIPLSKETYNTLIPDLKKTVQGMGTKFGVDYLMRFTRYAFLFGKDSEIFGKEKRFSPEETLLSDKSDCEDRVALFFYLVKEIYNLPMIVLAYPEHVTIAVKFNKPVGTPIIYNGMKYSVCEPTPQKKDLAVGQLLPNLRKEAYEVVYAYTPLHH